jgi:orotidine-5'-phosphate decarboxylase
MALKEAPGLMPAIDMNTGRAIVYINRLKGLENEMTGLKMGSQVIGGGMAYHVMDRLLRDIDADQMPKVVDLQKGGTDIPDIIKKQLEPAKEYNYEGFIGHPLGSGFNPDAMTEKEYGSAQAFVKYCQEMDLIPIVVLELTPPGSTHFLRDGASEELARVSYDMGVRLFVCPATRPERIKVYREIVGEESRIISTGVGPQKTGDPLKDSESAVLSGADDIVIGRAMINSENPVEMGKRLYEVIYNAHRKRKGL